jgi:catechol 2,3-dioxygenase-like lactoylglutathione lyase family enzyme
MIKNFTEEFCDEMSKRAASAPTRCDGHLATEVEMAIWPGAISAITLFTTDLDAAKAFYTTAFDLPVHYENSDSAVFLFGGTMINLLIVDNAAELLAPAQAAPASAGCGAVFTLTVDDVDAVCVRLAERGIALLNGPVDRPWGIRTASFADPDGHVWEIAR